MGKNNKLLGRISKGHQAHIGNFAAVWPYEALYLNPMQRIVANLMKS